MMIKQCVYVGILLFYNNDEVFYLMKSIEAKILLYSFKDEIQQEKIQKLLNKLQIKWEVLAAADSCQKIGYLVGSKGFKEAEQSDEPFDFDHEVMVFYNIKGKRLDQVLLEMKAADINPIKFKAVVTPFNMFWSLRRLCETVYKEHAAMIDKG